MNTVANTELVRLNERISSLKGKCIDVMVEDMEGYWDTDSFMIDSVNLDNDDVNLVIVSFVFTMPLANALELIEIGKTKWLSVNGGFRDTFTVTLID